MPASSGSEKKGTELNNHRPAKAKRGGLGRGLSALIPDSQGEDLEQVVRPMDILLPASGAQGSGNVARGGSARDLLNPARRANPKGSEDTDITTHTGADLTPRNRQRLTTSVGEKSGLGVTQSSDKNSVSRETSITGPADHNARVDPRSTTTSQQVDGQETSAELQSQLVDVPGATFADIPLSWIIPNTRQPRTVFDEDELDELSKSIKEVGVLQPIVIRPINTDKISHSQLKNLLKDKPDARYELIMGERRLRASELAQEESIPAIIKHTEDEDLLRDALLENLHRSQLNAIEEAAAYAQLMEDFGTTQEQLSKKIARSRPQIANTLRLLKLPHSVQRKVGAGVLSAGHARALLGLNNPEDMEIMADRIISEGLSVRTTEELIRLGRIKSRQDNRTLRQIKPLSDNARSIEMRLSDLYETRVSITEGSRKGRIIIEFAGSDDLDRIMGIIDEQAGGGSGRVD